MARIPISDEDWDHCTNPYRDAIPIRRWLTKSIEDGYDFVIMSPRLDMISSAECPSHERDSSRSGILCAVLFAILSGRLIKISDTLLRMHEEYDTSEKTTYPDMTNHKCPEHLGLHPRRLDVLDVHRNGMHLQILMSNEYMETSNTVWSNWMGFPEGFWDSTEMRDNGKVASKYAVASSRAKYELSHIRTMEAKLMTKEEAQSHKRPDEYLISLSVVNFDRKLTGIYNVEK